jgi:hypothetical protein
MGWQHVASVDFETRGTREPIMEFAPPLTFSPEDDRV